MIPAIAGVCLPAMSDDAIERVRALETALRSQPQLPLHTRHLLHAGIYSRTVRLPAGAVMTGVLIKIPTVLIVTGNVTVYIGGDAVELAGHNVIPAAAGRKQAFVAHTDTDITMLFPTTATSIEDAENEFTDEADLLLSREQPDQNVITITGG